MSREFKRIGIRQELVSLTGVAPELQVIIPAQVGFSPSITQIIASNQLETNTITFYEGATQLLPNTAVASSGVLFIDDFGGAHYELSPGSGLNASLGGTGTFEVSVFYLLFDNSVPITKEEARTNTKNNITVSRGQG